MSQSQYEKFRVELEKLVVDLVEETDEPVDEVWHLVTDISVAKWETT